MEKALSSEKLVSVYPNTRPITNGSHPCFHICVPVHNFC